jgi:hypothetical protein
VLVTPTRFASRVVGTLAVLVTLAGLAACSPAAKPLSALRLDSDRPTVLLAGCPDFQIDSLSVYPNGGSATAPASGPSRRLERTGSEVPDSMPLFGTPPAGWSVSDDGLTALAPGEAYGFTAYAQAQRTVTITFTPEDLAALGAGEVLIGKQPSSHEKVTEKEFRERAKDSC